MQRVSVVGTSGGGKSTVGRAIAEQLDAPFTELDAVHHLADWTPIDPDEFVRQVTEITAGDRWVVDGNYRPVVRDGVVWERADTVVWLDVAKWRAMWQVMRRTIGRGVSGTELWNGNREKWRDVFSWDPERSMIRWVWTTHGPVRARYERLMVDERFEHLDFVRLRTRREIEAWISVIDASG